MPIRLFGRGARYPIILNMFKSSLQPSARPCRGDEHAASSAAGTGAHRPEIKTRTTADNSLRKGKRTLINNFWLILHEPWLWAYYGVTTQASVYRQWRTAAVYWLLAVRCLLACSQCSCSLRRWQLQTTSVSCCCCWPTGHYNCFWTWNVQL